MFCRVVPICWISSITTLSDGTYCSLRFPNASVWAGSMVSHLICLNIALPRNSYLLLKSISRVIPQQNNLFNILSQDEELRTL